jgi:hypothetical protein
VRIPHDARFTQRKSILDANKLLLLGDESYSLSKQIIEGYENMQLNPLNVYYLKYFRGITLKQADSRRFKKEPHYLKQIVPLK